MGTWSKLKNPMLGIHAIQHRYLEPMLHLEVLSAARSTGTCYCILHEFLLCPVSSVIAITTLSCTPYGQRHISHIWCGHLPRLAAPWLAMGVHADHLKLIFPMCWAVAQIAWAMVDGEDVLRSGIYDGKTNQAWALQTLLHGVEFLLKCHVKADAFVIQVCIFWRDVHPVPSSLSTA
jgi:hypothetical protein